MSPTIPVRTTNEHVAARKRAAGSTNVALFAIAARETKLGKESGSTRERRARDATAKRHPYDQWSPDARALDLVGDKWTLLIVRDLAAGPRRFVELQRVLPGISTEQLRSRLNRMVADGMLTRKRYREVPPRVDYELTPRAQDLMPILGELARWGYEWARSAPRAASASTSERSSGSRPDCLGGDGPRGSGRVSGDSTAAVTVARVLRAHPRMMAERGRRIRRRAPDPRVTGDTASWIEGFAPAQKRAELRDRMGSVI